MRRAFWLCLPLMVACSTPVEPTIKRVAESQFIFVANGWTRVRHVATDGTTCDKPVVLLSGQLLKCDWKPAEALLVKKEE